MCLPLSYTFTWPVGFHVPLYGGSVRLLHQMLEIQDHALRAEIDMRLDYPPDELLVTGFDGLQDLHMLLVGGPVAVGDLLAEAGEIDKEGKSSL